MTTRINFSTLLWFIIPSVCYSFSKTQVLCPTRITSSPPLFSRNLQLRGLSEWRDIMFDFPGAKDHRRLGRKDAQTPPKEICILPFPFQEVLLQGETKQLRLHEEHLIQLFDTCLTKHAGVMGMGLLTQSSGIVQTVPLCEIEAYNRMEGFGIFVTIRAVSRARLLDITQQKPFLKAVCVEVTDVLSPNPEVPNIVASNIENFMLLLSSMEFRLTQAKQRNEKDGDQSCDIDDDGEMERRINIAKLDDRFYNDFNDHDDDDEEEENEPDRRGRFRKAYQVALATDMQGYQHSKNVIGKLGERTFQELTAISWAAFCTEYLEDILDCKFRIQALDCDNLFDRLKIASYMLRQKKEKLVTKLERAGLKIRGEDDSGDGIGGAGI